MPTEEKSARPARRSLLKDLLFVAVACVFVVIILHVGAYFGIRYQNRNVIRGLRDSLKATIPHFIDYLDIRLDFIHPFLKMTLAPDQNLPFCRINHQGHRGPDFVREKTGAFRVAIIGGSVAMGWFANSESETIHACLKAALEKSFPRERFEVYNFAVPQYNSTQELFVLETEALGYSPDFVIILSGINDFGWAEFQRPWQPHCPLGWAHMRSIINPGNFQEGWHRSPGLLRSSFKWSFLARVAWQNFQDRCSPGLFFQNMLMLGRGLGTDASFAFNENTFQIIGERTRAWAENVELMGRLLDSFGIPYCASLQPCAFVRRKPSESEVETTMKFRRGQKAQETAIRYWNTAYPAAEQALAARPHKIRILDMTRVFETVAETTYFDHCHYNARGTELIARRYAEHLQPFVQKWREAKGPSADRTGLQPVSVVSLTSTTL
jgi:lysophospholipase L1-like esterase